MEENSPKQENILKVGVAEADRLDDMVRSFRLMNKHSNRRRFVVSRENVIDGHGNIIVEKAKDIDIPVVKQFQRSFDRNTEFKIFSSDEGIAIVTNTEAEYGKDFSKSLINQVENIGGGIYKPFIDIVRSFYELFALFQKGLSPKLIIVGYIPVKNIGQEVNMYNELKRHDPYIRYLDVLHSELKPRSFIKGVPQFMLDTEDEKAWHKFVLKVIHEYTKPYFMEEI